MSGSPNSVELQINGRRVTVMSGVTVAAALALSAMPSTRTSVSGEPRTPVCGMGICQECRVLVDGRVRLACQTLCGPGMQVECLK
jgi:aerobic-type carbon monoxide dehydrogenase small subunit (CoxS/CutS family)